MEVKVCDSSLERFLQSLEKKTIAKTLSTLDLLEEFGPNLRMLHSKQVGRNLFELRVGGKQKVRLVYTFLGGAIVLVHGFVKKSKKTPRRELAAAEKKLKALA